MPTKRNVSQLNSLTDQIIKKNDNEEITAIKDNSLRKDFIASFINWMTGGLLASSEVGYTTDFTPTSNNAFARVDMIKGTEANPLIELYMQSPDNTVWKITIDNTGEFQKESI